MDEGKQQTWITSIQDEAERLTLKRLKEDKDERDRLQAEEDRELARTAQADNKKKA
jgi:hypothetical protein